MEGIGELDRRILQIWHPKDQKKKERKENPEVAVDEYDREPNNVKDGASTTRGPFPHANPRCDGSAFICAICGYSDCDGSGSI